MNESSLLEMEADYYEDLPVDEGRLCEKVDAMKDVAFSLWKEVQALGAAMNVTHIERGINLYEELRRFEIDLIRRALEHAGGSQTRAAQLLGINLTTLNSKIRRYNIPLIFAGGNSALPDNSEEPES